MKQKQNEKIIDELFLGEKKICAVVFGGVGYERDVSRKSCADFLNSLLGESSRLLKIFISKSGEFFIYTGKEEKIGNTDIDFCEDELIPTYPVRLFGESGFLLSSRVLRVERVFLLLHGDYGEDGRIQGAFETAGIKYFGADTLCSAVMADKAYTKALARSVGVPTLDWLVFRDSEISSLCDISEKIIPKIEMGIGYPVFIKPCRLGSSIGAGVAKDRKELYSILSRAFAVSSDVMAEPCLSSKREIECAYFSFGVHRILSMPGEVLVKDFYDYDLKYNTEGVEIMPIAELPSEVSMKITEYTERLISAIGTIGIGRFDYFLTDGGRIYFNEVNAIPGLTSKSLYPLMLSESGISRRAFASLIFGGV